MKSLVVVAALATVGCAPLQPHSYNYAQPQHLSQTDLDRIAKQISNHDCPAIDANISLMEQQLKYRGLTNRLPEDLDDEDRVYNATAKVIIWSLRIGCNNPNRYVQQ